MHGATFSSCLETGILVTLGSDVHFEFHRLIDQFYISFKLWLKGKENDKLKIDCCVLSIFCIRQVLEVSAQKMIIVLLTLLAIVPMSFGGYFDQCCRIIQVKSHSVARDYLGEKLGKYNNHQYL